MSVLGHMLDLIERGLVVTPDATPTPRSRFDLVTQRA
jgi:hypothetical protein